MPVPPDARMNIRERLDQGALPRKPPAKMYAGRGTGRVCGACDQPIAADDIEYEWEADNGRVIRLHRECAGLVEEERGTQEAS
jgi:hypothetical protein